MARRVAISNGTICGCREIGANLAIRMIQNGDAVIDGNEADYRISLTFKTVEYKLARDPLHKAKALWNGAYRAALTATQSEELYQGLRYPGEGQIASDGPVSAKLTVVRKYRRNRGLIDWGEKETFPRKRFNGDKLPPPIYSESAYRLKMGV
jgi:hypothetical protein